MKRDIASATLFLYLLGSVIAGASDRTSLTFGPLLSIQPGAEPSPAFAVTTIGGTVPGAHDHEADFSGLGPAIVRAGLGFRPHLRPLRETRLSLGGLLSVQPDGYVSGGPYLNRGLGGLAPGLALGVERAFGAGLIGLETSGAWPISATQSGREVSGGVCGPISGSGCTKKARHSDVLISPLLGLRVLTGRTELAVKAGVGAVLSFEEQGYDEGRRRSPAVTGGFDLAVPIGARTSVGPSFRYSRVFRGDDSVVRPGLGNDIVRIGVALRFRLGS